MEIDKKGETAQDVNMMEHEDVLLVREEFIAEFVADEVRSVKGIVV